MYQGQRIGVVYQNRRFLDKWFEDFFSKIDKSCISSMRNSSVAEGIFILLKDGTIIKSVRMSEQAKGDAFDKIYVDPDIDISSNTFQYVIKPFLKIPNIIIEG